MARLPSSRHAVHRGLRIPDLREGDDSPLRISHHHGLPATCRSRRLPTQRLRPCGLNDIFQTRSQQCTDILSSQLPGPCHDVHAVPLHSDEIRDAEICDAVVLEHFPEKWIPVFRKEMRQTSNLERFPATVPAISWVCLAGKRSRHDNPPPRGWSSINSRSSLLRLMESPAGAIGMHHLFAS